MYSQTITIRGKLDVLFRNGRYGRFPVATLHTPIGSFSCRDEWLEGLDTGSFTGEFEIGEITLTGYMTRGAVREQRTFIKAVVCSHAFDGMDNNITESEYDTLDDPILDEGEAPVEIITEPVVAVTPQPEPVIEPDWLSDTPAQPEPVVDEMVIFVREQLRSVGNDINWNCGDAISIPADLGRAEQRKIRDYLLSNGYKMTDPMQRLWEVVEEATYA